MNKVYRSRTYTKTSMLHADSSHSREIPSNLRLVSWDELKNCADSKFLGKGAFAKCFVAHLHYSADIRLPTRKLTVINHFTDDLLISILTKNHE